MAIKVRAIAPGYFGTRRRVDDEFSVPEEQDVGSWMEPVSGLSALHGEVVEPVTAVTDTPEKSPQRKRGPGRHRKTDRPAE